MTMMRRAWMFSAPLWLAFSGCSCDEEGLVEAKPKLVIEPLMVDFGKVPVTTQRLRGLKLVNEGQGALEISSFVLMAESTELAFATPVPDELAAGQELTFNLVYEPTNVGIDRGQIVINASDQTEPHVVEVQGEGVAAGIAVSHDGEACGTTPDSLSFGRVVPGNDVTRTVTIRAAGTAPVTILSAVSEPGTTPELTIENVAEPRVLQPGDTLTLAARYAPTDGGTDNGAFVITTDVAEDPSIRIVVCAESVAPALCARPSPLDLGAVAVGGTVRGTLTLESCGLEPLNLTAVALANDAQRPLPQGFQMTPPNNLPQRLEPGQSINVDIEYTAPALGAVQAWVAASSDALGSPESFFAVIARGAMPCDLSVAPTNVVFGNVAAGMTSQRNVLVANNGATPCTIDRLEITQGATIFSVVRPAVPATVPGGASEIVTVQYAPSASGMPDTGTLEVEEGGVARQVALSGNPGLADGCHLEVDPPFINFGVVPPGQTRTLATLLRNVGSDPCTLRGVELAAGSSPDFSETSPSLGFILPNRTKQLSVTYRPTQAGTANGTLTVNTTDVTTGTFSVPIFGASAPAGICVTPRRLPFGNVQAAGTMDFTISACGGRNITVTGLDWTAIDPEFALVTPPGLPLLLNAGQSRTVTVRYQPADQQGDTAELVVRSDDLAEPAIPVLCTGGTEIVPASAGRYLYYWQIPTITGGDIMRLPLQGVLAPQPWWGPRNGKSCAGCHAVSPDGRYVAVIEAAAFRIVDTTNDIALALPNALVNPSYLSWRPDVNTNPPYQYAYDDGYDISIGSVFDGVLRKLVGADDPQLLELMPSWGPNGQIAFARGMAPANTQNGGFGFMGAADILVVSENGGVATLLQGASGGGASYYPEHSPDGRWIAITHSPSAQSTIGAADVVLRLVASDNSGTVMPLNNANSAGHASSYPTWSRDGRFLSFSSNRPGGAGDWDLYLSPIDPVTGQDGPAVPISVANGPGFEHAAEWSP